MHGLLARTLTNTLLHPSVHTLMSHSKHNVCTLLFMASQRYVAVTSQRHAGSGLPESPGFRRFRKMWSECRLIPQPTAQSASPTMCLNVICSPSFPRTSHPCKHKKDFDSTEHAETSSLAALGKDLSASSIDNSDLKSQAHMCYYRCKLLCNCNAAQSHIYGVGGV